MAGNRLVQTAAGHLHKADQCLIQAESMIDRERSLTWLRKAEAHMRMAEHIAGWAQTCATDRERDRFLGTLSPPS